MNIPVIVDEMNVMYHLKKLNIYHISWTSFYSALKNLTGASVRPYFACANVNAQEEAVFQKRKNFFQALEKRGIEILEGFSVKDHKNRRIEKGVDVLVALQIYKAALAGAKDIIVCSADTDLVPAIKDAQALGVRVHCVISDYSPSSELVSVADSIIRLETILDMMIERGAVRFIDQERPYITSFKSKSFGGRCVLA